MELNARNIKLDPNSIAAAIKNRDLNLTADLLKEAYEGSNKGSHLIGVYDDGVVYGKITHDLVTKASWLVGTAGSVTGLYLAFTSNAKKELMSQIANKEAENHTLIQTNCELVKTNGELVRTNSELVASNNELTVANNELEKACQAKVGTSNSGFTWLFGSK